MNGSSSHEDNRINVIPANLLAMAKDARYMNECKHHLMNILRPFVHLRTLDQWEPIATGVASLLYTILVVVRKRRSAGMEVCSIQYAPTSMLRWKLLASVLLTSLWEYSVRRSLVAVTTNESHHSIDGESNQVASSAEALTGASRREVFELQRMAMHERASGTSAPTDRTHVSVPSTRPAVAEWGTTDNFSPRLMLRFVRQALHSALVTPFGGPHGISDNSYDTVIRPNETANITPQSLGVWIVRLHLAFYCINGRYPSWMHRLIHRAPLRFDDQLTHSPLVHNPTDTAQIVGWMIVLQASWTLLQTLSLPVVHRIADWTLASSSDDSQRQEKHIQFEGIPAKPVSSTRATCVICRQARYFPACPVTCGHVFCWHCLHQWVALHSAACPLCRTPCTSSDITLLHNYDTTMT